MLWYYNHNLKAVDEALGTPYDTVSAYPHLSVCAFVNWPFGLAPRNPAEVLPLCYIDEKAGFIAWRNRWQDLNDTLISVATGRTRGYHAAKADKAIQITSMGEHTEWGQIRSGGVVHWWKNEKGDESVFTMADGSSFAVDFTGKCGADVMLVTTGKAKGKSVKLGAKKLTFLFPTTDTPPTPEVNEDKVIVGKRVISLDGDNLSFAE